MEPGDSTRHSEGLSINRYPELLNALITDNDFIYLRFNPRKSNRGEKNMGRISYLSLHYLNLNYLISAAAFRYYIFKWLPELPVMLVTRKRW